MFDALIRSDFFPDIFSGDFTIPENLGDKSTTDGLAAMDGNHGAPAIGVTQEVMASLDPNKIKTKATKRLEELGAVIVRKMCLFHESDTLNTHELIGDWTFNFQTQLDGFLDPFHQDIDRLGLCMVSSQSGHGRHKISVLIFLDYNIEFLGHSLFGLRIYAYILAAGIGIVISFLERTLALTRAVCRVAVRRFVRLVL